MNFNRFSHTDLLLILVVLFSLNSCAERPAVFLEIDKDMLINETGNGNCYNWFDEQDTSLLPLSSWITHGNPAFWDAGMFIDFRAEEYLSEIFVFNGGVIRDSGQASIPGILRIYYGNPFEWIIADSIILDEENTWIRKKISLKTRYLKLEKKSSRQFFWKEFGPFYADCDIREIMISGKSQQEKELVEPVKRNDSVQVGFDSFIGINAYAFTPDEYIKPAGIVREYLNWGKNGVLNEEDSIDWSYPGEDSPDEYYRRLSDKNIIVVPCVHRHVDEEKHMEERPDFGGDPLKPDSYALFASYLYQMAARYGSVQTDKNLMKNRGNNPEPSGAGWIKYIENWNEPDRWWGDEKSNFSPYEFAAFCSACYDGDMGRMGKGYGVKNADPEMKLVMGGTASIETDYVAAMKIWSDYYRGGSFPADVLNFHHYNNTQGSQFAENSRGISPEAGFFRERMEKIVSWRNLHLPEKEIWITEFGWDTFEDSRQSATGHSLYPGGISMEEIQADWLMRAYLAGAAAGVDRMFMYLVSDLKGDGLYRNCGLVDREGNKKASWYYLLTLKNWMKDMVFEEESDSGNEKVIIYRFKKRGEKSGAYVIWCPTSDGTRVKDFRLKLTGLPTSAIVITPRKGMEKGESMEMEILNNSLLLDISEKPIIVVTDEI